MKKTCKSIILALAGILILIGLDQWTKLLAVARLSGGTPFVLIDGVFEFHYTMNHGAAFGILQEKQTLFVILTILVVAAIGWLYLFRIPDDRKYMPLNALCIFTIAGALGNFIDRARLGYVIDFLYFKLIDFPVFNVADCYITLSCAALILLMFFYYKEEDLQGIF